MNQFGLGLVLSLTDNLSGGVDNAINSLNGLVYSLEKVDDTASTVSLMALCSVAQQVGDTFETMGESILGVFSSIFERVMDTGSLFEGYRITLNALYGDAQRANETLQKMFDFAVTSPVDMENVMPYIVKLKTLGLDAFDSISNKAESTTQNMINWVTDFMSVAGGMGASADRISRAVINFLNPENTRSLMMMKNIFGDVEGLIAQQGDTLGDTIEARVKNLTSIVTSLGADGITENMMGTWSTMLSNMEDVFMQFWLGIADGGAFDSVKASLMEIVKALNEVDTTKFGQVLADSLKIITVPLQTLAQFVAKAIRGFTDFATAHPFLTKIIVSTTALLGVALLLSGVVLKLGAQFGMMAIGISLAGNAINSLKLSGVMGQFVGLGNKIKWLALALTAFYVLWNKDFAGIKTKTIAFVNNVKSSFTQARSIVSMNCNEMKKAIDALDADNPFDNFTKGLVKLGVLFGAIKEGISNRDADGNFIVSTNTYAEMCALGLEGLVGRVFDVVYAFERFIDGFKTGWQMASDALAGFLSGFKVSIKGTFLDDLITKIADFASGIKFNRDEVFGFFETMGEYAGKLAPVVLALMSLKTVFGGFGKLAGGLSGVFGSLGAIGSGGGFVGALIGALNPLNFASLLATGATQVVSLLSYIFVGGFAKIANGITQVLFKSPIFKSGGLMAYVINAFSDLANPSNFGGVFKAFGNIFSKGMFSPFKMLSKIITGPFQLVGKLIGALANPVGAVLAVITGIGSAFTFAYEKSDAFRQKINDLLGLKEDLDFSHIFDGLKEGLGTAWEVLKSSLGDILSFDWLKNGLNFGGDGESFGSAFETIKTKLLGLWETVQPILARLGVVFAYVAGAVWDLVGIIGNVLAIATKAVAPLLQGIVSAVMIAINTIIGYVQGVVKVFSGVWDVISGIIIGLVGLFTGNDDLLTQAGEKIKTGFSSIVEGIKQMFSSIINGAKDWIVNLVDTGYNMVMGIWDGFLKAKDYLWSAVKNFFGNIVNAIKNLLGIHSPSTVFAEIGTFLIQGLINGVEKMFSSVVDFFRTIIDGIKAVFTGESSIAEFFGSVFQEAYDLVTGIFSTLGEFFGGVWQKIVDLFSNIGSTVGEAVSNTVSKAVNAVLNTAVTIINGFISAINFAIDLINAIPGVSISKLDKLSVPEMATGGVVDKATLAVVGEAGKEAVMPLENNTGWINELAGKIGAYMGVGTQSTDSFKFINVLGEFATTMHTFMRGMTSALSNANTVGGLTTVVRTDNSTSNVTTISPVTNKPNYGGSSYYNTSNSSNNYITKSQSTTTGGSVDNSVTFASGSIVIQANGCSDAEAERLATLIMKKIERKGQIRNLTNYRSIVE